MKFQVAQQSLVEALAVVAKGSAQNSTLPILSGIHIAARDGVLEFMATNLSISIKHVIPAAVEEAGEVVLSGRLLQNIAKNLPDLAVSFELEERNMTISCGKSSFKLTTLDPRDFPKFPEFSLEETVELPSSLLQEMVDKVYKVSSKDNSRPILQGILLTVEDNTIRLVATDSYRLAVCDANVDTASLKGAFSTIVPATIFHDVVNLPSVEAVVNIGTTDSQIVFQFGNTTYISRKIEGTFPNYKQLLPSTCNTKIKFDIEDFAGALKRVSLITSNNPKVRLDVDPETSSITLSASAPDQGESSELIPAEIEGEALAIALNFHYIFDCLSALSGEKNLDLELNGAMAPGVFKSYAKVNYLYLLMPVRM